MSKFVQNVVHLYNTNNGKLYINGKPYNKAGALVSSIALETAAVAVAVATVAVAAGVYGVTYFHVRSLRGEKVVLGNRAYGEVQDTDWRLRMKVGGQWHKDDVNKAFTKNGEVLVFCDSSVEADLRASLDASGKASGGASDDSSGGAAPPAEPTTEGGKSEGKSDEKSDEKPRTALQLRHESEENFVATVMAAEALGIPVERPFKALRDVFLALSCARDEEAKPEAFASLNKARGEALRMVFAIGSSSVPEVQEAFVAYTVAAVKAREEKEKGKAASAA